MKGGGDCVTGWSNPGGPGLVGGLNQGGPGSVTVVWFSGGYFVYQIGWTEPPTGGQVHRGTRFHDTPGCQILFDKFGKVLEASRFSEVFGRLRSRGPLSVFSPGVLHSLTNFILWVGGYLSAHLLQFLIMSNYSYKQSVHQ